MKQTRKLLALGALLCSCGAAMAQSDLLLVANPTEGNEEQSVPVYVGSTVTFTSQGVEVSGSQTATFTWGSFSTLSFKVGEATGIAENIVNSELRLRHNPAEYELEFVGYDGNAANLAVFDLNGRRHLTRNNWSGENVDITSLSPGVYFVTINNKTIKFIKK